MNVSVEENVVVLRMSHDEMRVLLSHRVLDAVASEEYDLQVNASRAHVQKELGERKQAAAQMLWAGLKYYRFYVFHQK